MLETVFDSEGFCSMGTMACYQRYERAFTGYVTLFAAHDLNCCTLLL